MEAYIDSLLKHLNQYAGKGVIELFKQFKINSTAKNKNNILAWKLIETFEGRKTAQANIEHENINIKTIQLKENGNPQEAMSFSPIIYEKIINEDWDNSDFKKYLSHTFIFFVFKFENDKNYLIKIIKWNIPNDELNGEVKLVWKDTKKKISDGTVLKEIRGGKYITWFLSEEITNICHIRPHGRNGIDCLKLPIRDKLNGDVSAPKQSFWFNHSYLKKIVDKK